MANVKERDLETIGTKLTAQKLLGLRATNTLKLVQKIDKGLPFSAFIRLMSRTGLPAEDLVKALGIKPRTFIRRKKSNVFTREESDRLVSLSRLVAQIINLFGNDEEAARNWMSKPNRALGGATPLEFASTETGTREVENLIGRLEHGVFL